MDIIKHHPIRGLSIGRRIDSLVADISGEAYAAIIDAISVIDFHQSSINAVDNPDCATKSQSVIEYYVSTLSITQGNLATVKVRLNDLVEKSKSKIR